MRIVGLSNSHDAGYCVLEDGKIIEHIEIERYNRLKETYGDSLKYFRENYLAKNNLTLEDVDAWVAPLPASGLSKAANEVYDTYDYIKEEDVNFYAHHFCHAAHAFYSSPFKDSYILTIDSEGTEEDGLVASTRGWIASENEIISLFQIPHTTFSLGKLWGRCTRYIFKLSAGYPRGHQAGSVMAMAALGDSKKYYDDFHKMATHDFPHVFPAAPGAKRGVYVPPEEDAIHPYLHKYRMIGEQSEQELFNMAASLQAVTEDFILKELVPMVEHKALQYLGFKSDNICFSGGVSLNSVSMGKVKGATSKNVFIPPVPYDGGNSIGACQHYWHGVLGNEKKSDVFVSPYLGEAYDENDVRKAIEKNKDELEIFEDVNLEECVDHLVNGKIIAIFNGRSESGRRALGNRSILANPAISDMKEQINEKVKHRQWYRPFAPSILEEHGSDWFEYFFPSPYMSFVFKIRDEKFGLAPAIEHFDATARAHSVSKEQNSDYYDIIKMFYDKTGVPLILNTSFNDREPICETPNDAINCFLGTEIDYLYFVNENILVKKNAL